MKLKKKNPDDVKVNPNVTVSKNELGEMQKRSQPCVICFHKVSKLKSPEEYYLTLSQLCIPWRNENELKQDNQSYEVDILCNTKKQEPFGYRL